MSGLTGYRPVPVRLAGGPMPGAMVFAVVCGVASVAAAAGVIGVIGCLRRWVWVRWAALLQAIAVSVERWYHPKPPVPGASAPSAPGTRS